VKKALEPGAVVHVHNTRESGGRDREDHDSRLAWAKSYSDSYLNKQTAHGGMCLQSQLYGKPR
jgi:hypothetical protein